jgi:hypothetical protein
MNQNATLSIRGFAKLIGVSEAAVRKAIAAEKLSIGWDEINKKIDPDLAMKNPWVEEHTGGVIRPRPGLSSEERIRKQIAADHMPENPLEEEPLSEEEKNWIDEEELRTGNLLNSIKVTSGLKASEAIRRREIIALALDKKKLEELEGVLVRRKDIDKALGALGNELKKALLNMPQRLVRLIMKAGSEVEGITILTNGITEVLKEFGTLSTSQRSTDSSDD